MKFNHFPRYLIIILAFCWACNKKDVIPNRPPASFTVKATLDADGKTVKLVWNRAIDPDGDNVTYAVFAKDTLAKNVSDTTYTLTNLSYNTSITGKIIAKDQKGLSSEATFTVKTAELTEILDVNFEQDLIDKKIDSDSKINGLIKIEDALKVTVLDISGFDKRVTGRSDKKIKTLSGIEAFQNLTELDCSDNFLTNLDLSNNTLLKRLDCSNNNITTLNITKNTFLEYLRCHVNKLTNLDLSKNTKLTEFYGPINKLVTLDFSKNTLLFRILCDDNELVNIDVSKNTVLREFSCHTNKLTHLDISKNTELELLRCTTNNITSLDATKNTKLSYLLCSYNNLKSLDVRTCTSLNLFQCNFNPELKIICIPEVKPLNFQNWRKDETATFSICK